MGRYRTTVVMGDDWSEEHGALLHLGGVFDTFRVLVNGRELPPLDQLARVTDLGTRLRRGADTIEAEVATTLLNRRAGGRVHDVPGTRRGAPVHDDVPPGPERLTRRTGPLGAASGVAPSDCPTQRTRPRGSRHAPTRSR